MGELKLSDYSSDIAILSPFLLIVSALAVPWVEVSLSSLVDALYFLLPWVFSGSAPRGPPCLDGKAPPSQSEVRRYDDWQGCFSAVRGHRDSLTCEEVHARFPYLHWYSLPFPFPLPGPSALISGRSFTSSIQREWRATSLLRSCS